MVDDDFCGTDQSFFNNCGKHLRRFCVTFYEVSSITSKCQVFFYSTQKNPKVEANWRAKRGTLSDFLTSIVAKHQKLKGRPFGGHFYFEKSLTMSKKLKGGPFSLARYCMLRGKLGKPFLVQFARRNGSI